MAFSRRSWGLHCWTKVITEHNNWESHRSINVCLITGCRKTTFLKITFLSCFLTAQQSIALMKALPDLFPSPVAPPKKLGHASEALLHILKVRKFHIYFTIQYKKCIVVFLFLFVFVSLQKTPTPFYEQDHSPARSLLSVKLTAYYLLEPPLCWLSQKRITMLA